MSPAPAALAARRLFEPYADLLRRFPDGVPDTAELDARLAAASKRPALADGRPVRLTAAPAAPPGYEAHIAATAQVPTRAHDWHDFFNALVWWRFPRVKAALNRRHHDALRRCPDALSRGAPRDALTLFDECGVLVCASDAGLLEALARHDWRQLFWTARGQWGLRIDLVVLGHATLDQLRAPFVGLCGKALLCERPAGWFAAPWGERAHDLDGWLADRLGQPDTLSHPRMLRPLPLLGVPGLVPGNADPAYYDDLRQFRPRPAAEELHRP